MAKAMFGQLRAAKGHMKSVRPIRKTTVLPSSFPFRVIAYSSSSRDFSLTTELFTERAGLVKVLKFSNSKSIGLYIHIKKITFPQLQRKIEQKQKEIFKPQQV